LRKLQIRRFRYARRTQNTVQFVSRPPLR
jgi:hypothetical protein